MEQISLIIGPRNGQRVPVNQLIHLLIDDAKCYQTVRPNGVCCPHKQVVKNGHGTTEVCRRRYLYCDCYRCVDDLTMTVFRGDTIGRCGFGCCVPTFMGLNFALAKVSPHEIENGDAFYEILSSIRWKASGRDCRVGCVPARHFTGESTAVSGFLRIHAQRPKTLFASLTAVFVKSINRKPEKSLK